MRQDLWCCPGLAAPPWGLHPIGSERAGSREGLPSLGQLGLARNSGPLWFLGKRRHNSCQDVIGKQESPVPCVVMAIWGEVTSQDSASPQGRSRSGQWSPNPTPGQANQGSGKQGGGEGSAGQDPQGRERGVPAWRLLVLRLALHAWAIRAGKGAQRGTSVRKSPSTSTQQSGSVLGWAWRAGGVGTGCVPRRGQAGPELCLSPRIGDSRAAGALRSPPRPLERPGCLEEEYPLAGLLKEEDGGGQPGKRALSWSRVQESV